MRRANVWVKKNEKNICSVYGVCSFVDQENGGYVATYCVRSNDMKNIKHSKK